MKKLPALLATLAVTLAVAGSVAVRAQIKRLSLDEMTTLTDNAIVGTIVDSKVIDLGNETDGYGLYYTVLTIEGDSIYDGRKTTVDVVTRGGWMDKQRGIGCWDSEAPSADEMAVGKQIVAYYHWVDNIGRGTGANRLYASHGSFYRTVNGPQGLVVMGRGEGYAINKNMKLGSLKTASRAILTEAAQKQAQASK